MRHLLIIGLICLANMASSQDKKASNLKNECFNNNGYSNNSVERFKDELELTLDVTLLKQGRTNEVMDFTYNESFESESSLIMINESVGLKISIARVVDFKEKKYLYKLDLFTLKDKCWILAQGTGLWTEFYPGVLTSGFSVGNIGTSGYLGFDGSVKIE